MRCPMLSSSVPVLFGLLPNSKTTISRLRYARIARSLAALSRLKDRPTTLLPHFKQCITTRPRGSTVVMVAPKEMWDARYGSTDEYGYGTAPNQFLAERFSKEVAALPAGARCLMLAEGEGRNAVALAELGLQVTGVDIAEAGLSKARKLATERGVTVETVVADLGEYEYGKEKWDLIVGIFCHVPPPIRERMLSRIPPALTPGGYFILECYTPAQLDLKTGGPPVAELTYTAELLEEALGGSLTIIRNEEVVREVVEGVWHTGKGAVVQFIGKKAQ